MAVMEENKRFKPSSYYDWSSRDISEQQIHRNHCELLVKASHSESKERYGYERLHAKLTAQGHDISLYMVRSIFGKCLPNTYYSSLILQRSNRKLLG